MISNPQILFTSYIDSSLRIGHSKLAEQIRVELQEKASGVFMWVVLVVDISNKKHDGGHMHELRQRLVKMGFRGVLSYVADLGDEVILAFLNSANIDADLKDQQGRTPLSRAAEKGHEGVVKLLLATEKVDADSKDGNGQTPLSWAAETRYETVVQLLLEKGAEIGAKDKYSQTPLSWTVENECKTVQLLLKKGVEIEVKDKYGRTPLL